MAGGAPAASAAAAGVIILLSSDLECPDFRLVCLANSATDVSHHSTHFLIRAHLLRTFLSHEFKVYGPWQLTN